MSDILSKLDGIRVEALNSYISLHGYNIDIFNNVGFNGEKNRASMGAPMPKRIDSGNTVVDISEDGYGAKAIIFSKEGIPFTPFSNELDSDSDFNANEVEYYMFTDSDTVISTDSKIVFNQFNNIQYSVTGHERVSKITKIERYTISKGAL